MKASARRRGDRARRAGRPGAVPLIAEFLAKRDGQWPWVRAELIKALGQFKSADHIGTLRDAMLLDWSINGVVPAGIAALAALDTDEAWAVIGELSTQSDKRRRSDVLSALEHCPGKRTVRFAAKALEDPEASVREAAYWTIYRVEPKLLDGIPFGWSEENGGSP